MQSKQKQRTNYNKRVKPHKLVVGDRVLLQNKSIRGKSKLADKWESSPYDIVDIKNDVIFTIRRETDGEMKTVHRNLLAPCMFVPFDGEQNTVKGATNSHVYKKTRTTQSKKQVTWKRDLEQFCYFQPCLTVEKSTVADRRIEPQSWHRRVRKGLQLFNQWKASAMRT